MPELKTVSKDLNDVYTKGITFSSNENRAIMTQRNTKSVFSVVYQPYAEVDNTVTGVTVIGTSNRLCAGKSKLSKVVKNKLLAI
jgi:hypothetical protein